MDGIKIGKEVVRLLTSVSVGIVIDNAIKASTPPGLNVAVRAFTVVGRLLVGSIIAEKCADYMVKGIDENFKFPIVTEPEKETE